MNILFDDNLYQKISSCFKKKSLTEDVIKIESSEKHIRIISTNRISIFIREYPQYCEEYFEKYIEFEKIKNIENYNDVEKIESIFPDYERYINIDDHKKIIITKNEICKYLEKENILINNDILKKIIKCIKSKKINLYIKKNSPIRIEEINESLIEKQHKEFFTVMPIISPLINILETFKSSRGMSREEGQKYYDSLMNIGTKTINNFLEEIK